MEADWVLGIMAYLRVCLMTAHGLLTTRRSRVVLYLAVYGVTAFNMKFLEFYPLTLPSIFTPWLLLPLTRPNLRFQLVLYTFVDATALTSQRVFLSSGRNTFRASSSI
jgi:hypothetical protein